MSKSKTRNVSALAREGGLARARNLTPEERKESARRAVNARWERYRAEQQVVVEKCEVEHQDLVVLEDVPNRVEARNFEAMWSRSLAHRVNAHCPCDECVDAVVDDLRRRYVTLLAKIDAQELLEADEAQLFRTLMGEKANRWVRVYRAIRKSMIDRRPGKRKLDHD